MSAEKLIEDVAQELRLGLHIDFPGATDRPWDALPEWERELYRKGARAAVAALEAYRFAPSAEVPAREPWRLGSRYKIHVYAGDRPVATFFREEDATQAVADHNAALAADPNLTGERG